MLRLGGNEAFELTKRLPLLLEFSTSWVVPALLVLLIPGKDNLLPLTISPVILGIFHIGAPSSWTAVETMLIKG